MTCRIEADVLALAVGKVLEIPNDPSAVPTGAQEVRVDRFDPDHHRTAPRRSVRQTALRNDDRPAAELKLRAVASDAQPDLESERLLEPFHGRLAIGVESPSLVLSASVILVVGLAIQSAALGL